MSQAAIALKEENRDGISIRSAGPNSNMVTNIKDHITCTRSMENYAAQESKVGIVSFPCDFDHMYASMSEGMVSSQEKNEHKHLKEICLQHLDLIQQQSELLARQDKQIQALRQENERLKKSLQRSDRRAGNSKANCGSSNTESKRLRSITPTSRHASPSTSENMKGPYRSNRSHSPKEGSQSPDHWRRRSAQRRQSEDGGASMSSEYEMYDDSSTTTVSQRSALRGKRAVGQSRKKQRGKRSVSVGSREVNTAEETNLEGSVPEIRPAKRPRKEETEANSEGGTSSQSHPVLTTTYPYYTAAGNSDSTWTLGETCIETEPAPESNGDVLETPQWRVKVYTSLYSMEGTENLDDEVFLKRHHRLEVDERRRKRWDVQRIREQRHIDKLKQREASSNALGGSKGEDVEDPVCSLWPDPEDAQYLEVSDELPVSAFGLPISKFTPSEFSLPWLQPGASDSKPAPKRRLAHRGRAGSSMRRRGVGRGGRRGDGAERK